MAPDEALDRSLGEYGAGRLRTRWRLEEVVPAADIGNRTFGLERVPAVAVDHATTQPPTTDQPGMTQPPEDESTDGDNLELKT